MSYTYTQSLGILGCVWVLPTDQPSSTSRVAAAHRPTTLAPFVSQSSLSSYGVVTARTFSCHEDRWRVHSNPAVQITLERGAGQRVHCDVAGPTGHRRLAQSRLASGKRTATPEMDGEQPHAHRISSQQSYLAERGVVGDGRLVRGNTCGHRAAVAAAARRDLNRFQSNYDNFSRSSTSVVGCDAVLARFPASTHRVAHDGDLFLSRVRAAVRRRSLPP